MVREGKWDISSSAPQKEVGYLGDDYLEIRVLVNIWEAFND